MSSARGMPSGLRPASAISGGDSQPDAENESALCHVRARRRPAGALNCQIDGRTVARERRAQAEGEGFLRHFLAVETERKSAEPSAQADGDDSLHDAGTARFQPAADIPSIERLDSSGRERAECAPVVMRCAKGNRCARNSLEQYRRRVVVRKLGGADCRVSRLSAEITALAAGNGESDCPRRMPLEPNRCGEPSITDAVRLRRADEFGAVGKKLRESNSIASREDMTPNPDTKSRAVRPCQRESHVIDRPEHLILLSQCDRIGRTADRLRPPETGL